MNKEAKDKLVGSPEENGGGEDAQNYLHAETGRDETKRTAQERMERRSRKTSSSAGSEKMERDDDRQDKMERHCSTGQSTQRAVAPNEEEEENHDLTTVSREAVVANVTLFWKSRSRQPLVRSDSIAAGIQTSDLRVTNTAKLQVGYVQNVSINKARYNICRNSDHDTMIQMTCCERHFITFRLTKVSGTIDLPSDVRLVYAERELAVSWAMTGITREVGTCSGGRQ
jgi:hypothetical protein